MCYLQQRVAPILQCKQIQQNKNVNENEISLLYLYIICGNEEIFYINFFSNPVAVCAGCKKRARMHGTHSHIHIMYMMRDGSRVFS